MKREALASPGSSECSRETEASDEVFVSAKTAQSGRVGERCERLRDRGIAQQQSAASF
jgi:hypothetical protein